MRLLDDEPLPDCICHCHFDRTQGINPIPAFQLSTNIPDLPGAMIFPLLLLQPDRLDYAESVSRDRSGLLSENADRNSAGMDELHGERDDLKDS